MNAMMAPPVRLGDELEANPSEYVERLQGYVARASRECPNLWREIDSRRVAFGKGWPTWCFCPVEVAAGCVPEGDNHLLRRHRESVAALAAWRLTQGIFIFEPTLLDALWKTPITGDLPDSVLLRLPHWCVYVATPGITYLESPLHGFFATTSFNLQTREVELRVIADLSDGFNARPRIILASGSLLSAIQGWVGAIKRDGKQLFTDAQIAGFAESLAPFVSILLYLCSDGAEVVGPAVPRQVQPTRTKNGLRWFPAPKPAMYEVGYRLGSALRRAQEREDASGDGSSSPAGHIRRAHWHSYWRGPRKKADQRAMTVKWLPPIPVNLDDEAIIPTIHRVSAPTA